MGASAGCLARPTYVKDAQQAYLDAVGKFWDHLLPGWRRLYGNGGPIVMVQLENEFGDYGDCSANEDDANYMKHLYRKATQHLGTDVIYTTVSRLGTSTRRRPGDTIQEYWQQ